MSVEMNGKASLWPTMFHRLRELMTKDNNNKTLETQEQERRADLFRKWLYGEDEHE